MSRAKKTYEAMATLVVVDALMQQMARHEARRHLPPLRQTVPTEGHGISAS